MEGGERYRRYIYLDNLMFCGSSEYTWSDLEVCCWRTCSMCAVCLITIKQRWFLRKKKYFVRVTRLVRRSLDVAQSIFCVAFKLKYNPLN